MHLLGIHFFLISSSISTIFPTSINYLKLQSSNYIDYKLSYSENMNYGTRFCSSILFSCCQITISNIAFSYWVHFQVIQKVIKSTMFTDLEWLLSCTKANIFICEIIHKWWTAISLLLWFLKNAALAVKYTVFIHHTIISGHKIMWLVEAILNAC